MLEKTPDANPFIRLGCQNRSIATYGRRVYHDARMHKKEIMMLANFPLEIRP
jgi:hypothetical protein